MQNQKSKMFGQHISQLKELRLMKRDATIKIRVMILGTSVVINIT